MATIRPFRAVRYDPGRVELEWVICPPYDVIDRELQAELLARDPYNAVRLELPPETPEPGPDRYSQAAATWADWLAEGILARDAPVFLVHAHDFVFEGQRMRRTGLFAALQLEEPDAGLVLPHERTLSHAREDRRRLIEAVQANLSPIWGVFDDRETRWTQVLEGVTGGEPHVTLAAGGEEAHSLWLVSEASIQAELAAALSQRQVVVADGNHRLGVALAYRQLRRGPAGATPAGNENRPASDHVLVLLTGITDPGLLILPTIRLLRPGAGPRQNLGELLAEQFEVQELSSMTDLTAALGAAPAGALAVLGHGRWLLIRPRDGVGGLLDVEVLQDRILGPILGLDRSAVEAGALDYTRDLEEAQAALRSGRAEWAFVPRAVALDQLVQRAVAGELMPQKTTYFWPKPPTGLGFLDLSGAL